MDSGAVGASPNLSAEAESVDLEANAGREGSDSDDVVAEVTESTERAAECQDGAGNLFQYLTS